MIDPEDSESMIISGLLDALEELPEIVPREPRLEPKTAVDRGIDAFVEIEAARQVITLIVEVKRKAIYPRDVREILWRLRDTNLFSNWGSLHKGDVPFLAAESISPGARDILRAESVGYFDRGGSLYLPVRGALYYIDKPVPKSAAKTVRALFSGKRSQVAHALLLSPHVWVNVKTIAERAQVSAATASETLSALERFEWLETRGSGPSKERRLVEPSGLLDAWLNSSSAKPRLSYRRFYAPMKTQDEMAQRIADICDNFDTSFAVTGEAAAQRYTPYLSNVSQLKCKLSSARAFDRIIADLDARPVDEGANLLLLETKSSSEFMFREQIDDIWVASPVLVYLELMRSPGRSSDMGEHLRRERIGF